MDVPGALEIVRLVADALDYAHRKGVLHRAVQDASLRLLAILQHDDVAAWADGVLDLVKPLIRADQMFLQIPDGDRVGAFCGTSDRASCGSGSQL